MPKEVYAHKWISLWENDKGNGYIVMGDGVMIVPIWPDGRVLGIKEYSVAYDENVLYLPSGAVDDGEAVEESVSRELQEEVGYKPAQLDYLGEIRPGSKYAHWKFKIYLARDLTPSKLEGDEDWEITPEFINLADIESLIISGQLQDGVVISALFLARSFLNHEISGLK